MIGIEAEQSVCAPCLLILLIAIMNYLSSSGVHMSFYNILIAGIYDIAMRKVESRCLKRLRSALLMELSGDILEIGAGTGANLVHYSNRVKRLTLCEPVPAMRKKLERRVCNEKQRSVSISADAAESLSLEDATVDHVVSTLVLCSVANPEQCLREIFRVLRPGGSLVIIEHVAATDNARLRFWQEFWQPLWRALACNCHLARTTKSSIEAAGFRTNFNDEIMQGGLKVTTPLIVGSATRP